MVGTRAGRKLLQWIEYLVLFVIGVATVVAIYQEIMGMVALAEVHLADLLLLFIYLEVLTMVGVYVESGQLPVRMPLYIAIVALARYLILDMKDMDELRILSTSGGALILAVAVLVIRYGHKHYPYGGDSPAKKESREP